MSWDYKWAKAHSFWGLTPDQLLQITIVLPNPLQSRYSELSELLAHLLVLLQELLPFSSSTGVALIPSWSHLNIASYPVLICRKCPVPHWLFYILIRAIIGQVERPLPEMLENLTEWIALDYIHSFLSFFFPQHHFLNIDCKLQRTRILPLFLCKNQVHWGTIDKDDRISK